MPKNMETPEDPEPLEIPVNGVIDLHTFHPSEAKAVVLAYLEACREKGITEVRIIHGKGKGVLRTQIHALLSRHPDVLDYETAGHTSGGWGATLAKLKAP
jgi:DNA-nicking Smr family endonuclease